jgi:hypothetical protein
MSEPTIGHNSAAGEAPATRFAKDQLKSIIERIERLEEEKKTIPTTSATSTRRPRATATTSRRCAPSCGCASRIPTSAPRPRRSSRPTCTPWGCSHEACRQSMDEVLSVRLAVGSGAAQLHDRARGLWIEMMAIMHEAEPYGSLLVKGKRVDKKQLAALAGVPERECTVLLLELEGFGVFARDTDGTIYSRRMRRDHAKAKRA